MGMRLRHVVCGAMKWALISNYMIDLGWLLSACPDLLSARKLLVVHGERGSETYGPCMPCQHHSVRQFPKALHIFRGMRGEIGDVHSWQS